MLSAVFKTVGLMVNHRTVGSIPAHFRQKAGGPVKKFGIVLLVSALVLMHCGKKAAPQPIEKSNKAQSQQLQ